MRRFAVAVLTGGESRRMGRDKARIEVGGTPLVARVIAVARAAGAHEVVTVGGPDRDAGVRHLVDGVPGVGPLAGIAAALGSLAAEAVVVLACDVPGIDAPTIRALVGALEDHDVAVARTDRLEPLCAAWSPVRCGPAVSGALGRGERAVHVVLGVLDVVEVPIGVALHNLNTPDDLRRFVGHDVPGAGAGGSGR